MAKRFEKTEMKEERKEWKESGTQTGEEENTVVEGNRRRWTDMEEETEEEREE